MESGQEGYNPLFKIQSLLDVCDPLYEQIYVPKKCLSIDESITKFKGRISFRQYLPAKPTKWGIKDFVLSESESGYCLKSKIYTGKSSFKRNPGQALGDQVVMELLDGYDMDNFYTSPSLFAKLEENNIGACGTVKANRKGMPQQLNPRNLKLKKGDDPVFMRSDNLVACAWHDTKRLSLLSTVDTSLTLDKTVRKKSAQGGHREVEKPVMAERYNNCMAGVDHLDQMLGTYQYPHKCSKWYHTIYHRKREVALVNAYIIFKKANDQNKLCPGKFRHQVIDGILEDWTPPTIQQARPVKAALPIRMTGKHFPDKYQNKRHKPGCEVCSDRKTGQRHQTSYRCKECDVPLCIVPCFEKFHTLRIYKG